MMEADRLLNEAVELDPNNSTVREARATLRRMQNRVDDAADELVRAAQIDPTSSRTFQLLAEVRMYQGRPEEALTLLQQGADLDPLEPNNAWVDWGRGACALLMDNAPDAVSHLHKAVEQNSKVYYFRLYLAAALGANGEINAAKEELAQVEKLAPDINSIARWRDAQPWVTDPRHWRLFEKAGLVGLQRAGMPET